MLRALIIVGLCISQAACSTYQARASKSRSLLIQGRAHEAAEHMLEFAVQPSDDQMLYLLDHATAAQTAGDYRASTQSLLQAEKIAEINDYHSISKITGSLLLNEGMVQYKGENYEKLLINIMLAINFLAEQDLEAAMVETRKINLMLDKMIREGQKNYEYHPFAYYLAGMIWEESKSFDDAFIDYKKAYKMSKRYFELEKDLIRSAYLSRRMREYNELKSETGIEFNPQRDLLKKDEGEVVLIFAQGWAPRKAPDRRDYRMPWLYPVPSEIRFAELNNSVTSERARTKVVYNVQNVALRTFQEDYGALLAKRIAARIIKRKAAQELNRREDGLGSLAFIAMTVADQADLRQWSTLPRTIQMARLRLPVGKHQIDIKTFDEYGGLMESDIQKIVTIRPRKKTFIYHRSFL